MRADEVIAILTQASGLESNPELVVRDEADPRTTYKVTRVVVEYGGVLVITTEAGCLVPKPIHVDKGG